MTNFSSLNGGMLFFFIALLIWSLIWKGLALWRAAKNNDSPWFVVMLILNTLGIMEIIYYFYFGKKKMEK